MSPTSYQTAPPRNRAPSIPRAGGGVNPPLRRPPAICFRPETGISQGETRAGVEALREPRLRCRSSGTWRSPVAHLSRAAFAVAARATRQTRETSEDRRRRPELHGVQGPQVVPDPRIEEGGLSSDGTWRSPVAHLNGVQGVAGSNPAVPIAEAEVTRGLTSPRRFGFFVGGFHLPRFDTPCRMASCMASSDASATGFQ